MHMCANFFAADANFRHFALILGTNLGIKCHGASICAFGMSVIINIIRTIKLWQTRVYAAATAILGRTNYDIEHCVKTYVCGVKNLVKDKPDPRVACFYQNNCFQVRSQVGQNSASKS